MTSIFKLIFIFVFIFIGMTDAQADVKVNSDDVVAWADAYFKEAMEKHRISGAGIVVTKGGKPIIMKGYGFHDMATGVSFDPLKTRVRIGSNTKTMIGTAIAQLLEKGLIKDLDDPINNYLKRFKVDQNEGEDITFWDLLTHSAGYEDKAFHLGVYYDQEVPVSAEEAEIFKADFIRPRGEISTYGNYNTELLSAAIEDITGQDIATYFQANIFDPVGMTKTRLPLDLSQNPDLATAYSFFPNGEIQPIDFIAIHPFVASTGAAETTLDDITKYMLAHLDEGKTSNPLGLTPETFDKLHKTQRSNEPRFGGFGMTFMEIKWGEEPIYGHGGSWPGVKSVMMNFPESDLTFFSVVLQPSLSGNVSEQLASLFTTNRYTPKEGFIIEPPMSIVEPFEAFVGEFLGPYVPPQGEGRTENLEQYVGTYVEGHRPHSNIEKLLSIFNGGQDMIRIVELDGNGGLRIDGLGGYIETAQGIFHYPERGLINDFAAGQDGVFGFTPNALGDGFRIHRFLPFSSAEKINSYVNPQTLGGLFPLLALVILTGILSPLYFRKSKNLFKKLVPIGMALSFLMIFLSLIDGYGEGDGLLYHLLLGYDGRFILSIMLANVFFALTLLATYKAYHSWCEAGITPIGGRIGRVYLGVFTISALVTSYILIEFNAIGFKFP